MTGTKILILDGVRHTVTKENPCVWLRDNMYLNVTHIWDLLEGEGEIPEEVEKVQVEEHRHR